MSPLLSLALVLFPARAAQTISGDALAVYYDDEGNWISDTDEACIEAYLDSEWVEFAWWGSPFQRWMVDFTQDSSSNTVVLDSEDEDDITVVSESDISTTTEMGTVYTYTSGDLSIVKTETWDKTGAVMLVHFEFSNTGTTDMTDLVFTFEFDPDQDQREEGGEAMVAPPVVDIASPTYNTLNDVQDLDADGTSEWVQSVGDESGHTVGYLACDPSNSELGHTDLWPTTPGSPATLTDSEGASGDDSMVLRLNEGRTLAAGGTIVTSLLVSFAATESDARTNALADVSLCETCDTDGDGSDNPVCGGDDCDETDATINPSATETWYDGIDSDCAGDSDYDADADGDDRFEDGGTDCDDTDSSIYAGAPDAWYDGIDSDCAENSDYDADADGDDRIEDGGTDCDDTDSSIYAGAPDTWYDGIDSDCAGNSDYDADADGFPIGEERGRDCDDEDPAVHPDATEIWYDGVDQDCRGDSDYDADRDGLDSADHGGEDCDDSDPTLTTDCGEGDEGTDGGGSDGGGSDDGGETDGGGSDDGGETDAEDDTEGDDTADEADGEGGGDKTACASASGSTSLSLTFLGALLALGLRRRER